MTIDEVAAQHDDEQFLKADGFDEAFIGYDMASMRLIYSVRRCIEVLMQDGMSDEDAVDYFEYNVRGAYVGEKTPIWCQDY